MTLDLTFAVSMLLGDKFTIARESLILDSLGNLRWCERPESHFLERRHMRVFNTKYAGKLAGSIRPCGRVHISISVRGVHMMFYAHQVIWAMKHGRWPDAHIDHQDMNPANNGDANLRLATMSQNCANKRIDPRNTSGFKGVSWRARQKKWRAYIKVKGRWKHLGYFDRKEDAAAAYAVAAAVHFGEFARLQ